MAAFPEQAIEVENTNGGCLGFHICSLVRSCVIKCFYLHEAVFIERNLVKNWE